MKLPGLRRANGFQGRIICTQTTKDLLLRLEPRISRIHAQNGIIEQKVRPYYSCGKTAQWVCLMLMTVVHTYVAIIDNSEVR